MRRLYVVTLLLVAASARAQTMPTSCRVYCGDGRSFQAPCSSTYDPCAGGPPSRETNYHGGGGGPGLGAFFTGRGLFDKKSWPASHSDFSLPIFQKRRERWEKRFKENKPDPRKLRAAQEQRMAAANAYRTLAAEAGRFPSRSSEAMSEALRRCREQAVADFDAIMRADGPRLRVAGRRAFDNAGACRTGSFSGAAAHYREAAVLARAVTLASERLADLLAEESALADKVRETVAAVAALPPAVRTPLLPPPPLIEVAQAQTPPPATVPRPPEIVEKAKKKTKSLLAEAQSLEREVGQTAALRKATEGALDEAKSAAADATKALKSSSESEAEKALERAAVAAETLRRLDALTPGSPAREPKGAIELHGEEADGVLVLKAREGGEPAPGVTVRFTGRGGVERFLVTDARGDARVPPSARPESASTARTASGGEVYMTARPAEPAAPAEEDVPSVAALGAAGRAREALAVGDMTAAAAAFEESRLAAPRWGDAAWAAAVAADAVANGTAPAYEAARRYEAFAAGFPGDPRASAASGRAAALRVHGPELGLPAVPVYEDVKVVHKEKRKVALPLPAFASPNWYLDLGGAAFGGAVSEYHALRVILFSTRWKLGVGTTAFASYKTPFLARVTGPRGVTSEKTDIAAAFPLEVAFAPVNFRVWRNFVFSPQLYWTGSSFATVRTSSLPMGEAGWRMGLNDYGVRVPFGPFAGVRFGNLRLKAEAGGPSAKGFSVAALDEKRTYAAFEVFFGGMFGVPKPL